MSDNPRRQRPGWTTIYRIIGLLAEVLSLAEMIRRLFG
jgi:hypothetical protein